MSAHELSTWYPDRVLTNLRNARRRPRCLLLLGKTARWLEMCLRRRQAKQSLWKAYLDLILRANPSTGPSVQKVNLKKLPLSWRAKGCLQNTLSMLEKDVRVPRLGATYTRASEQQKDVRVPRLGATYTCASEQQKDARVPRLGSRYTRACMETVSIHAYV